MTIQLHRLEGFYWVAKEGGYAAAARAFPYPITQPGVHRQVRKLEDELAEKLFERIGHDRIVPTDAGRELFDFCRPFFEGLEGAVHRAKNAQGMLRIDAGQLEVSHLMPAWIKRIRKKHTGMDIQLFERSEPDLDRLRSGASDLCVDYFDHIPDGFTAVEIGAHRAYFLMPQQGKRPKKLPLPDIIERLTTQPFITFPLGTRERQTQLQPLRAANIEVSIGAAASSVIGILSLVEAGLGVSLVPWPSKTGPKREGVQAVRVDVPGSSFPIHAVRLDRRGESPAIIKALALAPKP